MRMRQNIRWGLIFGTTAAAIVGSSSGHAATYLTVAEAKKAMFPAAASFVDRSVMLNPAQRKAIQVASGVSVRTPKVVAWEARDGAGHRLGWLLVDEVLGKHEFITYALALDPSGAVRSIEVLDYRETYGGEIRNPKWRAQFTGKRQGAALKLDKDIHNISGATLSCRHVTDGVKRLLATHAVVLAHAG